MACDFINVDYREETATRVTKIALPCTPSPSIHVSLMKRLRFFYTEPRESVEMSCDELECMGQGEKCVESVDGVGKCACISSCDDYDVEPVCGDDGTSYDNGCYLDAAACKKRTSITKAKEGRCEGKTRRLVQG